jgi:diacylglycerol kinase (ATP)
MAKKGKSPGNMAHAVSAAKYSIDGFKSCFRHELAFRQEVFLGVVNIVAVAALPLTLATRVAMVVLWLAVVCAELLNSAIEAVVDLASPGMHPLAKRAKDYGSAAVACMLVAFFGTWAVVAAVLLMKIL